MAKKILLATGILVGALALGIAIVFLVDFESPELGKAVVDRVNEATGAQLTVGSYRLNLIRGLELEEVDVATSLPAGTVNGHLDGLVLRHRLVPLLTGTIAVEQIVVRRPEIEILEKAPQRRPSDRAGRSGKEPPSPETPSRDQETPAQETGDGGRGGLTLEIAEILIEDGSVRVRREDDGEATTSLTGLNVRLRDLTFNPGALSPLHGLTASGQLGVETLLLDSTRVREVEAEIELDRGAFQGRDVTFQTDQGRFRAELTVNFNQIPLGYTLALRGDPLDVNAIAGSADGGFGAGVLELDAEGFGTDSRGIQGQGVLHLAEGKLPSSPTLIGVENAIGRGTSLVGAPYQATEARFHVENNRLTLEGFQLETPQAALELEGTVDLDGPLALSLVLRTPREGLVIKEVPAQVLDALADDRGWVAVPLRITGTREEPRVLPDSKALLAQAKRSTGKVIEEEVKSFFQRTFN